MDEVDYVGPEALRAARSLERWLLEIPVAEELGILFVSVRPCPGPGGGTCGAEIVLGTDGRLDPQTVRAVIVTLTGETRVTAVPGACRP